MAISQKAGPALDNETACQTAESGDLERFFRAENGLNNDAQFFDAVLETLPADAQGFCCSGNPEDSASRIAPSYAPMEELKQVMRIFPVVAELAAVEKLLEEK